MKILVIAEHDNHILKLPTHHTIQAARELSSQTLSSSSQQKLELSNEIDLLVIGWNCQKVAEEARLLPHIKTIMLADDEVYSHQLAENTAELIAEIGKNYDYILMAASTFGKNILPRVAALLDTALISDVIKILSADMFERPIYAGNAIATVKTNEKIKLLTIRTTAFNAVKEASQVTASIQKISEIIPNTLSHFENQTLTESTRPELTSARIIISGGRGLKSAENFHLLEEIADRLGAAVGASRAAVDAGFAPNDYQIGQTGKVVAPDLYIAVGISGAIQHLAGMKDSKIIVAINNDAQAPIFELADYGLVGDLFKILPELKNELDKNL